VLFYRADSFSWKIADNGLGADSFNLKRRIQNKYDVKIIAHRDCQHIDKLKYVIY